MEERCGWALGSISALLLLSYYLGPTAHTSAKATNALKKLPEQNLTGFSARRGDRCGHHGTVTQTDFAVESEATLLTGPIAAAPPVQFGIGTDTAPAPLERSASVRELCRDGDWSEVYVASYPYGTLQGWVPSSALRTVPVTKTGRRLYRASDFTWPKGSEPAQAAVITIANRIMEQPPQCLAIDSENLSTA